MAVFYLFGNLYTKTPWDAAPWYFNFADTLFLFTSNNFHDTLPLVLFTKPQLHCSYSILTKIDLLYLVAKWQLTNAI